MKNQLFAASVATPAILVSTLLLTQSQIVSAETIIDDGELQLSITANRRAQSIDKTMASVTVITRKDIEKTQTHDIVDLLRQQRGISIARTGGMGSQTSVFMRGTESDHVLVLLDGVRIMSATTGFDWSQIPTDQVDRIEIVRGPRAALYGSDAIGGVIEITTRKNTKPYISLTIGKYGTEKASAGFSNRDGKNQMSLNVSQQKADGFSAKNSNATYGLDPDKDGHKKTAVSLSFSRQFNDKIKAGVELFHGENEVDFDIGESESELETINAYLQSAMTNNWMQKLNVSHSKNDLVSSSSFGEFTTDRKEVNWQNNVSLSDDTALILGANYREENGKTSSIPTGNINNKAIYSNINHKTGAVNLDLSVRHDKHSQAGNKTTGQAAVGFDVTKNTAIYASYGNAFRAPNINDLYYPGSIYGYAGNPDLKPETSKTFEIGLKSRLTTNIRLETSVFNTKVRNLINNSGDDGQAINIDKANIKGLEIGLSGNLNKLDWGLNTSFLRTENEATGDRLVRRPDHKISLDLGYNLNNKTRLGLDAVNVGSRLDVGDVKLDSYSLLNLSLKQKLGKRASVGLRVENVTDEDYELVYGYNTPKRGAYLTFSYK